MFDGVGWVCAARGGGGGGGGGGGVEVGSIMMWSDDELPDDWLWCDGAVYPDEEIPLLAARLKNRWGGEPGVSTAVPNMNDKFPLGCPDPEYLGVEGGAWSYTLGVHQMPHHGHYVNDPGHSHGLYDAGHGHGLGDPGHAHSVTGHAHGPGNLMRHQAGPQGGWSGNDVNYGVTDVAHEGIYGGGTGMWLSGSGTGIWNYGSGAGIWLSGEGGNQPYPVEPPWLYIHFIIKYQ
jgi:microcystin-dependent protein